MYRFIEPLQILNLQHIAEWWQQARRLLRLLPWTLQLLWQSHRVSTTLVSALTLVQALIPVAQLWLTKLLVDQVMILLRLPAAQRFAEYQDAANLRLAEYQWVGEGVQRVWFYLGLEAALLLLGVVLGLVAAHWRNILQEHLVYHVQLKLLAKSAELDLAAYEAPEYYDQLHRAQQEAMYGPIQLLSVVLEFAQAFFGLLSVVTLVLYYQPWVAVVLVFTTLPSFWAMIHYGGQRFMLFNRRTADGRRAEYLSNVLTSDTYAKEVRVWGLPPYLTAQIERLRTRFKQENIDLSRRQAVASLGGEILSTAGYYSAYVTVVAAVIAGRLSLGDLTLYAGVFSRTQSLFEAVLRAIAQAYEIQLFAEQLQHFLQMQPVVVAPAQPKAVPALKKGLTVQNLCFSYPDTVQPVLQDVSFTIEPGQCVALVGINGSGKSTLVKCLLRLYDPDSGTILADGCDLRDLDPTAWRRNIGVVFQDYARYQLTARENIGLGNLDELHNEARIRQAAQAAGIDSLLSKLPSGYESLLGRHFEGGHELSLGQWQRVALARALLRNAPLMVLDEPTAAVDPQAEYELFQQFRALAQDRMTLLISHRFSTVRMADLILVLADGRIIERGTHHELLAKNKQYAHLFKLQAQSYQLTTPSHPSDSRHFEPVHGEQNGERLVTAR